MRMKWLALLGCALLSVPPAAIATENAESSAVLTLPARNVATPWNSGTLSSGSFPEMLAISFSASAQGSNQAYWAIAPTLWTAQDAISAPRAQPLALQSPSSMAPAAPECLRPASISNAWGCSIKPLTRYDLPLRHALRHLWPLHGAKDR